MRRFRFPGAYRSGLASPSGLDGCSTALSLRLAAAIVNEYAQMISQDVTKYLPEAKPRPPAFSLKGKMCDDHAEEDLALTRQLR